MCGIFGFTKNITSKKSSKHKLEVMSQKLIHRGPDATGYFEDDFLAMGMNRLAIVDLDIRANQPMYSDEGRYVIVYNGEIYNYTEVRKELETRFVFKTESDTEVLLNIFIDKGIDGLNLLNGMFSFCIYDTKTNNIYLGRDRLGVKPLYYSLKNNQLIFASEMKGILSYSPLYEENISQESLAYYMIYETIPEPNTIFTDVFILEPGRVLKIDKLFNVVEKIYWSLPKLEPDITLSEEEVISKVQDLLEDAIKIRLRSDVDIGVFLSGGIDSTLIAAISKKYHPGLMSFSIGYIDKKHDESIYAERTAKYFGLDHHTLIVDPFDEDESILNKVSDAMVANRTYLPYLLLSKYASKYIKVALNGDGGDEFFCGYSTYNTLSQILKLKKKMPKLFWKIFLTVFGPLYIKFNLPKKWVVNILNFETTSELLALFQVKVNKKILKKILNGYDYPNAYNLSKDEYTFQELNYNAAKTFLPNTVLKTSDMANMAFSIEGRSPFLDYRLIEFSARIPESLHTKNGESKYILKKVLERYMARELFERPKKGFSVPLNSLNQFRLDMFNNFKNFYIKGINK